MARALSIPKTVLEAHRGSPDLPLRLLALWLQPVQQEPLVQPEPQVQLARLEVLARLGAPVQQVPLGRPGVQAPLALRVQWGIVVVSSISANGSSGFQRVFRDIPKIQRNFV